MSSDEKYMQLFKEGCNLSKGLIQLDGQPYKNLGFFEKRKLKKAKEFFELSSLEEPGNAAPCLMIAKVHQSLGEIPHSLAWLLKAWELEPANLILVIELSGAYGVLAKHKEAISVLEEGIKYHPNEPRILFNLGITFLLDSKPKLAAEIFQKTVEIEPNFSQNHKLLKYSLQVSNGTRPIPRNQSEIAKGINNSVEGDGLPAGV